MKDGRVKNPQNRRTRTLRGLAFGAWLLTVLIPSLQFPSLFGRYSRQLASARFVRGLSLARHS